MDTDKHGFLYKEETHQIIACAMGGWRHKQHLCPSVFICG